jgi:hypothetical protein
MVWPCEAAMAEKLICDLRASHCVYMQNSGMQTCVGKNTGEGKKGEGFLLSSKMKPFCGGFFFF